jgi:hypothetical protein
MAEIPRLVIVGTPDGDDLVAAPTRPWTGLDDDNTIQGLDGDDRIQARGGNDRMDGGPGDDTLDGGSGSDTAVHSLPRQAYEVFRYAPTRGGGHEAVVRGPEGVDVLLAVEHLEFRTATGAPDRAPLTDFSAFPAFAYLASNPDLANAFGGSADLAWLHFRDFGAKEDRATDFDGLRYVAGQRDLAARLAPLRDPAAIAEAGAEHFILHGRAEGRAPEVFNDERYLFKYPDLLAARMTPEQATLHFIIHGLAEGRTDQIEQILIA